MGLFDFLFGRDRNAGSLDDDRNTDLSDDDQNSDFDVEDWRSVSEDRRHHAHGSSNWTSREDWDCDSGDYDGMSGFDSYEDNDF